MAAACLFGYALESEVPLTRIRPAPSHRGVIRLHRAPQPRERTGQLVSQTDGLGPQIAVMRDQDELSVWCDSTGWFGLNAARRTVAVAPRGEPEWWEHRLGSMVVPLLLGELGDLALHAAAVQVQERILVICGQSGAGKSTLSAALALAGHAVLSEDGVVISGLPTEATVWPGLDGVRVAAATFARLSGQPVSATGLDKPVHLLQRQPATALPAGAIVFLQPRSTRALAIERIDPIAALPDLVGHVFCPGRVSLPLAMRRSGTLLDLLPAYRVALPDDLASLAGHAAELIETVSGPRPERPPA